MRLLAVIAFAVTFAVTTPAQASFQFVTKWAPGGGVALPGIAVGKDRNLYITRENQADLAYVEIEAPMESAQPAGTLLKVFPAQSDPFQFSQPWGIGTDPTGNVFVVDRAFQPAGPPRVAKFDADGVFQSQFGEAGTGAHQFRFPEDVAVTANGIYVADATNHRVQQFDLTGAFVRMWGADVGPSDEDVCTSSCKAGTEDPYVAGHFSFPGGIASDADGNVYVTDGRTVQKFTKDGAPLLMIGSDQDVSGPYYLHAHAVTVLPDGRIAEADQYGVRIFSATGTYIETIGTQGSGDGQFSYATDIARDSLGYLYVIDNYQRVEVFKESTSGGGTPPGGGNPPPDDGGGNPPPDGGGGNPPPDGGGTTPEPPKVTRPTSSKTPVPVDDKHWQVETGLEVVCPNASPCFSALKAHSLAIGGKLVAAAAKPRKRPLVGSATIKTAAGKHKKLAFKLNGKGRKLLKKKHRLKIAVTVTTTSTGTTPVLTNQTLTLKLRKHRKRG